MNGKRIRAIVKNCFGEVETIFEIDLGYIKSGKFNAGTQFVFDCALSDAIKTKGNITIEIMDKEKKGE